MLCASLVLTTLIIFAQIIMRSVFNNSLTWSEELTRYIFIWQIWLGVSIAQKEKQHIKVELLFNFFKGERFRAAIDIVATLILIAFNIFLVVNGSELVRQMYVRNNVSGAMRLPLYIVYAVLPLSAFLLSLRLIGQVAADVRFLRGKGASPVLPDVAEAAALEAEAAAEEAAAELSSGLPEEGGDA
ncbi:MAG: TRAP transporter small permease [Firmicutes bacterium]|nr:TRAP transporter small permease [Bacillota bacterium]